MLATPRPFREYIVCFQQRTMERSEVFWRQIDEWLTAGRGFKSPRTGD